jgi:transposase
MGRLFAIEAGIRAKPPDERCRQRQRPLRTSTLPQELRQWLELTLAQVSAKSPMAGWPQLSATRLALGVRSIGSWMTGASRRITMLPSALRAVATGRKNYLYLDPRAVAAARDTASEQRLVA